MNNKQIIARKYANAFLNLYINEISEADFSSIKKLEKFFDGHRKAIFFLSIPNISDKKKEKLLGELFEEFGVDKLLKPLMNLLFKQKRIFLIDEVLKHIGLLYKERKNIMMFNITSSHQLDNQDLEIIKKFLAHRTGKKIISEYKIDKSIVAGIRLQSDTLLWEYSIYKQCETLRKQFNI